MSVDQSLFDLADRRLAWLDERQSVLAKNIANANTPGYEPRDLMPFNDVFARAFLSPAQTSPMHLTGFSDTAAAALANPTETEPDGNGVAIDKELTKVADTDSNQALVSDLYKKYLSLYRTALGR